MHNGNFYKNGKVKLMKLDTPSCTGCAACANICKTDAIKMIEKEGGFKYPFIDIEKCVDCRQCMMICERRGKKAIDLLNEPAVYAMHTKNDRLRSHSTSGGIFSELAAIILKNGGYIVGAAYKEDWSVEHCMIQNIDGLEKLRRSKYLQSDINYIYIKVKKALEKQSKVLFSGTPCQVGGLKAFLGKEYQNLFTCDFICRGVSSPKIFAKYIQNLKKNYDSEIDYIWMKNKCKGWHNLTTVVGFKNGKKYIKTGSEDSYVQLYLKYNAGVRNSCYKCQFKGDKDVADITLGDFWGLEDTVLDDDQGTSAVICRTKKGQWLVNEILGCVIYKKMSLEDVKKGNPCLSNSIGCSTRSMDEFYRILEKEGYVRAVEWMEGKY